MTSFAELTTLRVGGPIADLVTAQTDDEVIDALRPGALVLGGGSNIVAGDAAWPSRVVRIATLGIDVQRDGARVLVEAAAGEPWDELVAFCVEQGWAGIDALSGIPGLVGATPIQNVGAYGQDLSQVTSHVTALDRTTGEVVTLRGEDCSFGYRTSRFKAEPDRWCVLSVALALRADGHSSVGYGDLARVLQVVEGQEAPAAAVRAAVLELRRAKAMVLDPDDPDTRSTGSFFTNPIVDEATASRLAACPRYPATGGVKLSAAWLIEQAGISRGFTLDERVRVSTRHTLALANVGGASAADVLALARVVRDRVREAFGVTLVPEPVLVGCAL